MLAGPHHLFRGSADGGPHVDPIEDRESQTRAPCSQLRAARMTPEQWERVKQLLEAALDRPPAERDAYLDTACADEPALRAEVRSLLAAHEDVGSFLGAPIAALGGDAPERSVLAAGRMIGRYRVLGLLGAGGMGQVYLAEDPRLQRRVALKLLPRELSRDAGRLRRFEQEARTASALSHPNVCVIHEVGEADDQRHFIAMEHVDGVTLRDRLDAQHRAGSRLPLNEVVDVGTQVAMGLAAAHEAGIVHRDVKPENVMLRPDGLVKILDFGLAKLAQRASGDEDGGGGSGPDTEPGMVLGTVRYMSPEQARGLPVDARTDVWSLGVVLYEMLAGHVPFEGPTSSDVMVAVLDRQPASLATLSPAIPAALRALVERALSKSVDDRFPAMREMAAELKRIGRDLERGSESRPAAVSSAPRRPARWVISIIAALVLAAAGTFAWKRTRDATAVSDVGAVASAATQQDGVGATPVRLAVLPFENLGRPEDAYFADGITDEVRGKLAAIPGLQVIARASSNQYRSAKKTPDVIARELGVRYLLTATVRWERAAASAASRTSRVRVSPELVELVPRGPPVTKWQRPFDAELSGVFEVQSEVAGRVAEALNVELGTGERERLSERPTQDLAAYDAFLKGEALLRSDATDVQSLRRAIGYYKRAVALDSTFARAWAGLAMESAELYANAPGVAANRDSAAIRHAAERALALAPHAPEGHLAFARYYLFVEYDPSAAGRELELGLRGSPNDVELLRALARIEMSLSRWDEALAHFQRTVALDPRSVLAWSRLGTCLTLMRRYQEARMAVTRSLALSPSSIPIIEDLAMVELAEGNLAAARAVAKRVPPGVDPAALAVHFASSWDLGWLLDEDGQRIVLTSDADAFGGDRLYWGLAVAQIYDVRGDRAHTRAFADSARLGAEAALRAAPSEPQLHSLYGVALAYLGRKEEAIREGRRGVAAVPIAKDAFYAQYVQLQLARIYILVGEHAAAIDQLELLLKTPTYLSPGWLRVDPMFLPLKDEPRFQQMIASR